MVYPNTLLQWNCATNEPSIRWFHGAREGTAVAGAGERKPLLNEQDFGLLRDQVQRHPGTLMVALVRLLGAYGKRF